MSAAVDLGTEYETYLVDLIAAGRFPDRATALKACVRTFQRHAALEAKFDAEIMKGIESAERGETIPLDQAFDRIQARLRRRIDNRRAA